MQLPRFEDYAVADTFRGPPAPVDLESDPDARRFRTVLREGAKRGPNFAGNFTVVWWGCGSSCQILVVVDARTGRVYPQSLQTMMLADFRRSSALLIADPPDTVRANFGTDIETCAVCGTPAAYVWRTNHFEPVGPGDHPHLSTR